MSELEKRTGETSMQNRREFFRKAGVAGGLGAAGALTLRKEYVKPVVRLLDPSTAYAQTPALTVGEASWTEPVMDFTVPVTPNSNTLVIVVDLPGGSAPSNGSTYNAFLSLTPLAESGSGWATMSNIPVGSTVNSNTIDNIGVGGPGGAVQFALRFWALWEEPPWGPLLGYVFTLNGVSVTPLPPAAGNITLGLLNFLVFGATGDRARMCCHVDADAGSTIHLTTYIAQVLGFWCFELLRS